jgi:hypothetical protein
MNQLLALLRELADPNGCVSRAIGTLAEITGFSESTVKRHLAALVDDGTLEIVTQGGGRGVSTLYRIPELSTGQETSSKPGHETSSKPGQNQVTVSELHDPGRVYTPPPPKGGGGGGREPAKAVQPLPTAQQLRDDFEARLAADGGISSPEFVADKLAEMRATRSAKRRHPSNLHPVTELDQ